MLPYITVFSHTIALYSLMAVLGALASIGYLFLCRKRFSVQEADVKLSYIYGVVGTFLGAKILSVLTVFPEFLSELPYLFTKTEAFLQKYLYGGFVFYGGLYGAIIGVWLYTHFAKVNRSGVFRDLVPVVPLVHAFGRIGCFCMGCCYGRVNEIFGICFTKSEIAPNGVPLIPVQLLEAGVEFGLFAFLAAAAKKKKNGYAMLGIYLLVYGICRFVLEFLRADAYRGFVGRLSLSQVISAFTILFGLLLLRKFHNGKSEQQTDAVSEETTSI